MCSRSRLVTTARIGESLRKERSLSSASATRYCVVPRRAFEPSASDAAADDNGWVETAGGEHTGHHGGGGGFAVHAGDGDAVLEAHEFGQHLGAGDDGNLAGVGFDNFRVCGADRRAGDDHSGPGYVAGLVAFVDGCAQLWRGGR